MFEGINYNNMNLQERGKLIKKYHIDGDWSMNRLAEALGIYVNKIKRDAAKLGLKTNSLSEAQKKALSNGVSKHPTAGTKRSAETIAKMSKNIREAFLKWDDKKRAQDKIKKSAKIKKQKNKPYLSSKKIEGIQKAARHGSKLEIHIFNELAKKYSIEFHKEDTLGQTEFHIDLFLPKFKIAIEIDGPAHYKNIWGQDKLDKNKEKDTRKTGYILQKGYYLIRFINDKKFSLAYGNSVVELLTKFIENIKNKNQTEKQIICRLER